MIDASHGNSGKNQVRQAEVVREIAGRVAGGEPGLMGLMLESFLVADRQELILGRRADLRRGQSITDARMDWDTTSALLHQLAAAVAARRARHHRPRENRGPIRPSRQ